MWKIFTLISESNRFAWNVLINNRLRTSLSLLGIAIGIFAIISVYSIVDSLEKNIRESVESIGSDVVFVNKWAWGGGADSDGYPWWKYFQRPEVSLEDYKKIVNRGVPTAKYISYAASVNGTLKYGNSSVENAKIEGVTFEASLIFQRDVNLKYGRFFSEKEEKLAKSVCVIGADISSGLFGEKDPVGRSVKTLGREFTVIGVMKKEGANLLGQSDDSKMWIPASLLVTIMGDKISETSIQLKAKDNIPIKMFKDDIRVNMRAIRRLSPRAEDDFSMNESSVISGGLDTMFSAIGIAGSIIGGFSILVGGFGIANIMFVSVRERTGQIGIQKALGAKSSFILLQFLVESILLSLLGGVLGILFVSGLLSIASRFSEFELFLSFVNVITGIGLSAFIGLLSGLAPASMASKLDPVEAIRFNQ